MKYNAMKFKKKKKFVDEPAYELGMQFPCCNDSRPGDKGCPSLSFVHTSSNDIHRPSEQLHYLNCMIFYFFISQNILKIGLVAQVVPNPQTNANVQRDKPLP